MRALLEVVPSVTAESISTPVLPLPGENTDYWFCDTVTGTRWPSLFRYSAVRQLTPTRSFAVLGHSSFVLRSLHTKSAYMPNRRAPQGPLNPQTWPFQQPPWWLYWSIFARMSTTKTFPGSVHGGVPLSFSPSPEVRQITV